MATAAVAADNTDTLPVGRCSILADGADVAITDTRNITVHIDYLKFTAVSRRRESDEETFTNRVNNQHSSLLSTSYPHLNT